MTIEAPISADISVASREQQFKQRVLDLDLKRLDADTSLALGREFLDITLDGFLEHYQPQDGSKMPDGLRQNYDSTLASLQKMAEEVSHGDYRSLKHYIIKKGMMYNKMAYGNSYNREANSLFGRAYYEIGRLMPAISVAVTPSNS